MSNESQQNPQQVGPENSDWLLEILVKLVNKSKSEIGITLQVGGFLVSGLLVSRTQYFDGFASDFSSAFSDTEAAEDIRNSFSKFGQVQSEEEEENPNPLPPAYIHLKEAHFFMNGSKPIPDNKGIWWRGRLSEVSGFCLGSLGA